MFTIPDVYVLFSLNDVFKKGSPEYWGGRDRKWEAINGKHVDIIRTKCMQISERYTTLCSHINKIHPTGTLADVK